MENNIRIGIGQINATVGDINANLRKIQMFIKKAQACNIDIISFPELALTGYPPEDLLLRPGFIEANLDALESLREITGKTIVIAGFADRKAGFLYNAAAVLYGRKIVAVYHKNLLPNYGVFDEERYFSKGKSLPVLDIGGICVGISICEDIWPPGGPVAKQAKKGAQLVISINASPYHCGKTGEREKIVKNHCVKNNIFVCYTNLVGGQDELLFDGNSFIANNKGEIINRAEGFKEDLLITDISLGDTKNRCKDCINAFYKTKAQKQPARSKKIQKPSLEEEVYTGLMTGLHDYASKNGFKKAVIGLSGGIDSALVAAIASDSMGKNNVIGVFMPSVYTSKESFEDAFLLSKNLGIKLLQIPINKIFTAYTETLESSFKGKKADITEENLQARIRGNILMALSNKFGYLVLVTGNKSETSVGYSTLYGDMAGGFGVIKDVYKTFVYKLAAYRNSAGVVIPERVLTKAPTAELKPGQRDQDTLPPYEILDAILREYIEEEKSFSEIIKAGFDKRIVKRVLDMVDRSEYKRRQSPPGIKITPKAFGRDRRIPITNRCSI